MSKEIKQNNPMFSNWCCFTGHRMSQFFKYKDQQEQNYDSLQVRENLNRSYHNYSKSRSRVDNNFNDINHQKRFQAFVKLQ